MDNTAIPDVRPPPAVDAWIILAGYVRKTWFQVGLTIIPFALVFLLAKRKNRKQHTF